MFTFMQHCCVFIECYMMMFLYWGISPEIFHIGGFALRYYSVGFMLAFISAYGVLTAVFRRERIAPALLDRLLIYIVAGTLVGARLGHCLFYDFDWYKEHPWEIVLPFRWGADGFHFTGYEGLASHGGAIGILVAAWLFAWRYRMSYTWLLDRLAMVVPLAGCFVRIGNFFNSEIIGIPTKLPWAVVFSRVDQQPRHPAQLYEAFCYLLIFVFLWYCYKRNARPGILLGYLLVLVFSARFLIEFVKEDQSAFEHAWLLNMGQLLSIPMIAAGICLLFAGWYRKKTTA